MEATIGIEVHVELKSNSKVFSNSKNSFDDLPNTNLTLIDYGYPGTLPKLNKGVIDIALRACLGCNCKINKTMHFDRKNYFYPDLPKGYQITQKDTPIGYDGYIEISNKKIELERIHIEEDTCKSIHSTYSLLNFNRAGVPLIEIVTKPVIKSSDEAIEYVERLRETLLYLDISDVKIEEGSMRCDVNVSVSSTKELGTKVEVKNIGSISNIKLAIEHEIKRQTKLINEGHVIKEQTRRFDELTKTTVLMREKETGNDYRYFIEPDIPEVILEDSLIDEIKNNLAKLPSELKTIFENKGLNQNNIKTLISNKELAQFLIKIIDVVDANIAANLLTGEVLSYLNKNNITFNSCNLNDSNFTILVKALEQKEITNKDAKEILSSILNDNKDVLNLIKNIKDLSMSDLEIEKLVELVLNNNPESIIDFKEGKDRAYKFLMGQLMKESKGKANPVIANSKLMEKLKSL